MQSKLNSGGSSRWIFYASLLPDTHFHPICVMKVNWYRFCMLIFISILDPLKKVLKWIGFSSCRIESEESALWLNSRFPAKINAKIKTEMERILFYVSFEWGKTQGDRFTLEFSKKHKSHFIFSITDIAAIIIFAYFHEGLMRWEAALFVERWQQVVGCMSGDGINSQFTGNELEQ